MPATAPRKATHALVGLSIHEGSLVDNGDNPQAHVVFHKRKPQEPPTMTTTTAPAAPTAPASKGWRGLLEWAGLAKRKPSDDVEKDYYDSPRTLGQIMAAERFHEEISKLRWAFMDSLRSIMASSDPTTIAPLMQKSVAEFGELAQKLVSDLKKRHPEADATNAEKFVDLLATLGTQAAASTKAAPNEAAADEARRAFVKTLAELEAIELPAIPTETPQESPMAEKAAPAPTTKSADEILAGLPEPERAALKAKLDAAEQAVAAAKAAPSSDVEKRVAEIEKRAAAAEAEVAKLRDEREMQGFVALAKSLAVGEVDEVAKLLKGAHAVSKEQGEALEKVLRANSAQIAKADQILTRSMGSASNVAKDSPEAALDAAAADIRKAKPALTEQAAYLEACKANPELYAATIRT